MPGHRVVGGLGGSLADHHRRAGRGGPACGMFKRLPRCRRGGSPVGCQKSACPVSCGDDQGQLYGIMIIRVLAPALSHLRPALRLAGPARPVTGLQGRRTAGAAARGRRVAPRQSPAPARLGRPRYPRRADPAPAGTAADAPAGHPRLRPALAPPPGRPQMDLPVPDRTAAGQRRDRRADRAARRREQQLGIPADPGRAAQARSPPGQRSPTGCSSSANGICGRSWPSSRITTTGGGPIAADSSARPAPTTPVADLAKERIKRRPVLGGLINEYERAA